MENGNNSYQRSEEEIILNDLIKMPDSKYVYVEHGADFYVVEKNGKKYMILVKEVKTK